MLLWIESRPTSIIALIVFGAAYLSAALIFCVAALLSRRSIAKSLQSVTPGVLSPVRRSGHLDRLSGGARMGELGSRAGANRPRSHRVARGRHAGEFPPRGREGAVREAIGKHLEAVVSEDWPAMAEAR